MKIDISVVAVFFDMAREAPRTLFSLSPGYQKNAEQISYEVIAIDNGSTRRIPPEAGRELGDRLRYLYLDSPLPSPAAALNQGVRQARGNIVIVLIDGARILSPGIIGLTAAAFRAFATPFVYTMGMHLGPAVQNKSILNGYNQEVEDRLLAEASWTANGYKLFGISSLAASASMGVFGGVSESNCIALHKKIYLDMGGMDERFVSPGGGLVNLDFFIRLHERDSMEPVMLLGEATFHQIHGGVATNVPMERHPLNRFATEYAEIHGRPYAPVWRPPLYLGGVPDALKPFLSMAPEAVASPHKTDRR